LRSRLGLSRYAEAEMIERLAAAGFSARRAATNIGHNQARMTFLAQPCRPSVGNHLFDVRTFSTFGSGPARVPPGS
jgi:hypothetical protein